MSGPCWIVSVSRTRPLPGVPAASIWYPVPGIAIELVKMGLKWPRKVRLTLPKGPGPPLKEVIFDRFWAHGGLHPGLKTREKLGRNGPKRLKTVQSRLKMAHQGPFDPPQGLGNTFENFQLLTVFGPIWPTLALGHNPGEQTTNGPKRAKNGGPGGHTGLNRPSFVPLWHPDI